MIVHAINMSSSSILEIINVVCLLCVGITCHLRIMTPIFSSSKFYQTKKTPTWYFMTSTMVVTNFEVSSLQVTLIAFFLGKYFATDFFKGVFSIYV